MNSHITRKNDSVIKQEVDNWLDNINTNLKTIVPQQSNSGTVYILLDTSWSMNEYQKLDQAKEGALAYTHEAITLGYKIGLITFDSEVKHFCSPTIDQTKLKDHFNTIYAQGTTNMTDAIVLGRNRLESSEKNRVLCIVTDGIPDNKRTALEEAESTKKVGIDIMTIGTDLADEKFLEKLASKTEFTKKVENTQLSVGVRSMAELLPKQY